MVGTETLGGSADDAHYTILAVSCGGEPTTPQGGESSGTPYNPSATATSLQEAGWQVLDQEESLGTCASVTEVGVHVPRVLVFTAHTSVEDVAGYTRWRRRLLAQGVVGKELLHAIRRTHAGRRVWLLPAVQSSHRARYTSPVSKDVFPLTITGSRAPGTKTDN